MRPLNADFRDDPLPLADGHWMPRRKARIITAIINGEITLSEASLRYQLTKGEFQSWLRAYEKYGVPGLRATRVQIYGDLRRR